MKSGYVIQRKDGKYLQRDASWQGVAVLVAGVVMYKEIR